MPGVQRRAPNGLTGRFLPPSGVCVSGAYPQLSASAALVVPPSRALTLAAPVGAFVLEVRQLQQLFAGQPQRGVHHQAGLLTGRRRDLDGVVGHAGVRVVRRRNVPSLHGGRVETRHGSAFPKAPVLGRKNNINHTSLCLLRTCGSWICTVVSGSGILTPLKKTLERKTCW